MENGPGVTARKGIGGLLVEVFRCFVLLGVASGSIGQDRLQTSVVDRHIE